MNLNPEIIINNCKKIFNTFTFNNSSISPLVELIGNLIS